MLIIRIINYKWQEIDVHELAQLTHTSLQSLGLLRDDISIVEIIEDLQKSHFNDPYQAIILARAEDQLLGWMGLRNGDSETVEMGPWHPHVVPAENAEEIASKLIKRSIQNAREMEKSRLWINFDLSPWEMPIYEGRRSLFDSQDMKVMHEPWLERNISETDFSTFNIPQDCKIRPLSEVDANKIFECWYRAFLTGKDRFFHQKNERQRNEAFWSCIESMDLVKDASLALIQNQRVVGFTMITPWGEKKARLASMGVHPEFKGKKLGKLLLSMSIKITAQQGFSRMGLDVDIENLPAYWLYRSLGFKEVARLIHHIKMLS